MIPLRRPAAASLFTLLSILRSPVHSFVVGRSFASASSSSLAMSKKVLVPIADGSEEIETTCIQDTLVRFGADVTVASVKPDGDLLCTMSRGIKIMADTTIEKALEQDYDLIALPGGMPGAEHLRDCQPLMDRIKKQKDAGKQYAAVCAAPAVALASQGLLVEGAKATCYPAPAFREKLGAAESNDSVVVSENLTTSQGPATALEFALQLGENLFGKEKRKEIANQMLVKEE